MILNLTPHPIRLYASERADGSDDLDAGLLETFPPEPTPARLAERDGVRCIVSLVVALALADRRDDLLVPYREVRNSSGTVIGCRSLAQPV